VSGRRLPRSALALLACALAVVSAGCGGDDEDPEPTLRGEQLTVYGSLPQQGPTGAVAADVLAAQQLALEQADGRAGRYRVRFLALDAASPKDGRTDPSRISENARRAADDDTTIAYLGELATGMSAVSIPLLNEAGILEVSPLDGAMTLTTGSVAATGSPERFYPRLEEVGRTFARVVPSDRTQADALLRYMRAEDVRRLAIVTDEDPSGRALATRVRAVARVAGVSVVAREEIDAHAREHEEAVMRIAEARPDAVLDATGARSGAARLWRELYRAAPSALLFGPASLADARFAAALGPAEDLARITRPLPRATGEGDAAGRRFARAFAQRYQRAPAPEAFFGYESMRGVLAAIERAARAAPDRRVTRAEVVEEYFRTQPRDSVLGPYTIDAVGDTSLDRWGAFEVMDGALRFVRSLDDGGVRRSPER
jgi:branched-chain amino acid transport system substrate-binding protein